ncbi:unnamed protein product [Strongylus vulgaris]|uniref:Uncharacterized protein n=1 Tax=Strongylus vulgaris TaxID=40348 RepID=A0A3P7IR08_STRVU|nr:unnamed protein product [Strongylus vulgaris]
MKVTVLVLVSSLHIFAFNLSRNHSRRVVAEKQSGHPQKKTLHSSKLPLATWNDEEGLFSKDADNENVDEKMIKKSRTKLEAGPRNQNYYAHGNVDMDDEASRNVLQSLISSVLGVRGEAVPKYPPTAIIVVYGKSQESQLISPKKGKNGNGKWHRSRGPFGKTEKNGNII